MLRSACFLVLLGLGFNCLLIPAKLLNSQEVVPVRPSPVRISDSSPLKTLSPQSNSISPAAFLRTNRDQENQQGSGDSGRAVPSIVPSNKRAAVNRSSSVQDDEIDPLNIPSSPIKRSNLPATTSGSTFKPSTSGFQPPKSTTFQPSRSIKSQSELPKATTDNKQPSSGFLPAPSKPEPVEDQESPKQFAPEASRIQPAPNRLNNPSPARLETKSTPTKTFSTQDLAPRVAERAPRINTIPRTLPRTSNTSNIDRSPDSFSTQQQNPQLKLVSSGPRSITVNKAGDFVVKILNTGQIDATDVMVGIEIPGWVEVVSKPQSTGGEAMIKDLGDSKGVVWNLSYLPAGRDALISLKLEPRENKPFNLKTEWTTAPVSNEAKVMVTQAKLATQITGPEEIKYGEKAVYRISIENTGNGDAEQVSVALSESLGGDSATVGIIKAGTTKQFEVELTAGQAGPLSLKASVKGDAGISSDIAKEIVVRRAKLAVKAEGPKFKYAGSALTYKISVENLGDATAKDITAAALLPLNAEYISGLNQVTENEGRKIGWKIAEIPAGSRRDFIVTCLVNQAGEARMEIGVRSASGLTSGGIVTTKVEALADLKLEVVDPRGPQAVGRQVVYELHIKNRGTKAATNIMISGEFSDFIDPVGGTGAKANIDKAGVISFAPIRELGVGQSTVVKVIAKASKPGTHTFRAIVECPEQDIRKVSEGTTKFFGEGTPASNEQPRQAAEETEPASESPNPLPSTLPSPSGFQPGN